MASRDISAKDSTAATSYIPDKDRHLNNHNFYNRLQKLYETETPDPHEFEKLDKLLVEAAQYAGKRCRKTPRHWYSTKLAQTRTLKFLALRQLKALRRSENHSPAIQQILSDYNLTYTIPQTIDEAKTELNRLTYLLLDQEKHDRELRNEQLETKAAAYAAANKIPQESAVRHMKNCEHVGGMFARIRATDASSQQSTQVQSVRIPSSWPAQLPMGLGSSS